LLKRINWRLSFITCLLCWVALEFIVTFEAPRVWGKMKHCEPISKALLKDRLAATGVLRQGKRLCVVLGDSVFYGSALREKGLASWASQTPPAYLREQLGPDWLVLDLSADGLQILDLLALLRATSSLKPDAVALELNMRMLAPEAGSPPACMSRPWLAEWLGAEQPVFRAASVEKRSFERLHDALTRISAVVRYAELARYQLFQPSAKDLSAAAVKARMPGGEELESDVLLDMKIRPYYAGPKADEFHLGRKALGPLAREIKKLNSTAFVFLTPQNLERISEFLDREAWKANRASFALPFRNAKIDYADLAQSMSPVLFLDHCHLIPQGNALLATTISKRLHP
jgi:hypothetical protein